MDIYHIKLLKTSDIKTSYRKVMCIILKMPNRNQVVGISSTHPKEHHKIGLISSIIFVASVMTGVSLFSITESLRELDMYAWPGWLICTLTMLILALTFGKLAEKKPGFGPYGYVKESYGSIAAAAVGYMHLAAIVIQLGSIVHVLYEHLLKLCITSNIPDGVMLSFACLYCPIILSALVNSGNISTTNRFIQIFNLIKYIPLIVLIGYGFRTINPGICFSIDDALITPAEEFKRISHAVSLIIFAFSGMEFGIVLSANKVHNPEKTIPRALWIGTILAAIIFTTVQAIVWTHIPTASTTPIPDVAKILFGQFGHYIFSALVVVFLYAALNTSLVITADLMQTMAKNSHLPSILRAPQNAMPVLGIWTALLLVCAITFGLFQGLSGYTNAFSYIVEISDFLLSLVFLAAVMTYPRLLHARYTSLQFLLSLTAALLLVSMSATSVFGESYA